MPPRVNATVYAGAQRPNSPVQWALGTGGSHGFGGSNALGSGVCETDALTEDGKARWIFGKKTHSRKLTVTAGRIPKNDGVWEKVITVGIPL